MGDRQTLQELPPQVQNDVFNDQERVNTLLARAHDDSRQVCQYTRTTGSNMPKSRCMTVAERRRIEERARPCSMTSAPSPTSRLPATARPSAAPALGTCWREGGANTVSDPFKQGFVCHEVPPDVGGAVLGADPGHRRLCVQRVQRSLPARQAAATADRAHRNPAQRWRDLQRTEAERAQPGT
ncbi:hypothetical protein G6F68_014392 [Rhizopus microsporus]|nr:hypothetical protein G6F68_014392 [Rhizopus microsporus]